MNRKKSNKEYLFVDGYNILNSWDNLRKLLKIDFDEARTELLEILVEYSHLTGIEVIVVFDGHLVKGNRGEEDEYKGIRVIFTKENVTADQYIERNLNDVNLSRKVRVATSDWVEQQIIFSKGAMRISAKELEAEVNDEKKNLIRKSKNKNLKNNRELIGLDDDIVNQLKHWYKSKD